MSIPSFLKVSQYHGLITGLQILLLLSHIIMFLHNMKS